MFERIVNIQDLNQIFSNTVFFKCSQYCQLLKRLQQSHVACLKFCAEFISGDIKIVLEFSVIFLG